MMYKLFTEIIRAVLGLMLAAPIGVIHGEEIKIGIRAHNGAQIGMQKWQATADFLSAKIPQHTFILIPYETNKALDAAVSRAEFDFVLTNPASHVEQKVRYAVSAIATLINKRNGKGYTRFGSVIFTRADRGDINGFRDLKGKSFMGVDEQGFGGWRMAWLELLRNGVDPYRHFRALSFGAGIQQNVVFAVRDGTVDAGSVRTDLLEHLASTGQIHWDEFKVLEPKHSADFKFARSTQLYPEWPFAKLSHTPDELARGVAATLYGIPADSAAAKAGNYVGWDLPNDYQPVEQLLKELRIEPFASSGEISLREFITNYWPHVSLLLVVLVAALTLAFFTSRSNRRLKAIKNDLETEVTLRQKAQAELESHQKQLEQIVNDRTAALAASNKELESYSYSIAHDLRSPLRSIIGFSQILEEDAGPRLKGEELESLHRIIAAGKHMAKLIDDILELSRITRSPFKKSSVNLCVIAQTTLQSLQRLHPQRKVDLKIQEGLNATGDAQLLTILLQNLLDNAWKFTINTPQAQIELGVHQSGGETVFYVKDNGVGFDMRYADKIFMPFQRLHTDTFEGTGIGLSTVQRVVQRHGGRLWVDSTPSQGSAFFFTLP